MKPRHDIYATVTAQLVAAIESGAGEWRMPWHHSGAPVMRPTSVAGRRYSGINRLVLWATADACGYASGIWATYQQWRPWRPGPQRCDRHPCHPLEEGRAR
jgi:antirestriction protein ArdC